ncbi:MAG: fibronectin type III domain-containing protein, partial [Actinomycetota bacterium]|nr:fibronectin type III domain-containing protein [Actinomycetota bacterium]
MSTARVTRRFKVVSQRKSQKTSTSRNRRGITTSLVIFLSSILGFGALPLFVFTQSPASASQSLIAPVQQTPVVVNSTTIDLSWYPSASPTVTGYNVYEGTTQSGENLNKPINSTPITSTNYVATVNPSGNYYFVVEAIDASSNTSPQSNEVEATPTNNPILYVSTTGSDSNNTTCSQTQPCLTIANAVSVANNGDTIDVAAGTYDTSSSGTISPSKDLTIQGAGASSTFVGGTSAKSLSGSVFAVNSGVTATITGMTIQFGYASYSSGGGIDNAGYLTATDDTVSDNKGENNGGGISNSGYLTATDDTVIGNQVSYGDGGGIYNNGTFTATNDTITNNQATNGSGGGIYNGYGGALTATNDTITNNSANGSGGGIYNFAYITITLTLAATIIADQKSGSNCSGNVTTDAGYNL